MRSGDQIESPSMGMRVICREATEDLLSLDLAMRSGAPVIPMHIHPRQEERITVLSGSVRSRSGGRERLLDVGDSVVTPPGEAHTIEPAREGDAEVHAELRPALSYAEFIERSFALDRAGHVSARGRVNPLRMAGTGAAEAEFYIAGLPTGIQKRLLRLLARVGRALGYASS